MVVAAAAALGVTWVGAVVLRPVDSFTRRALVKAFRAENCLFLRLASCRMPSLHKADSQECNPAKHCPRYLSSSQACVYGSHSLSSVGLI